MKNPISMSRSPRDVNDVAPLSESDASVIQEVAEVLGKHNALERFGLTLLHQHFPIGKDEVLLETTDVADRRQLIRPVPKSDLNTEDYMETSWRLDTGEAIKGCASHRPRPPK